MDFMSTLFYRQKPQDARNVRIQKCIIQEVIWILDAISVVFAEKTSVIAFIDKKQNLTLPPKSIDWYSFIVESLMIRCMETHS